MKAMAALLAIALAWPPVAHSYGVQELFEALGQGKPRRAQFHEKKVLALLDKPVESSGELSFTPPARLEKRTVKPRAERVVIEGDLATVERGNQRQALRLSQQPGIAALVDSIRSTLAGDLNALTKNYSAAVAGDAARWRLTLRPLDPALSNFVEHVEISGSQGVVRTVEIFQADGDRSVMTLTPLEP
jgi:Outer membrane lipoprotein carrier protein LolA-like